MRKVFRFAALAALIGLPLLGVDAPHHNPGYDETDLVVDQIVNGVPTLTDANGIVHIAAFWDPNLLNPWGVAESATSPFWVSDNGNGTSSLYNTAGMPQALLVSIPVPSDPGGAGGAPTGLAFNKDQATNAFEITGVDANGNPSTHPAVFLFDTEDGTILGWHPQVNPPNFPAGTAGKHAIIAVNNSGNPDACHHAIYKGLAMVDNNGTAYLYAANFRAGTVEVYDSSFNPVSFSPGQFTDPTLPERYAPFNVVPITMNNTTVLFVTYAKQDKEKHDDVAGNKHGFVNIFDLSGNMIKRFVSRDDLNSPWGVVLAPASFGQFANDILIGNFGNGRINAYDPATGNHLGKLKQPNGDAVVIDGLWTLMFGNGGNGGHVDSMYFTAGPNGEEDGLFGFLKPH